MQSRVDVLHFEMNFQTKTFKGLKMNTGRISPVFLGSKNMFERNSFEREETSLIAPLLFSVTVLSSIVSQNHRKEGVLKPLSA